MSGTAGPSAGGAGSSGSGGGSWIDGLVRFCVRNKVVVAILLVLGIVEALRVAPFDWRIDWLPRDPVPVDAIPDTGANQQIVFTEWPGRSPQDVEDQVTYPLTVALLGVPGVETIRSTSMFGFSSVFVIFEEGVEFYWSRSRILEKLASLPAGTLPDGVQPALGPDATALGQVFWYTLEGHAEDGRPTGGWGLDELRSVQDWHVRYALASVEGVAEVASVGGHVREYQIDVDPDAMRAHGVALEQVFRAVQASNLDVGARTVEINRAEYVVRGLGFLRGIEDLEHVVVAVRDNVPITIAQIARVGTGPALRRGVLDKGGTEAVGGVVVVRYGANPLEVIGRVKQRIAGIAPGLPAKTLDDGTVSRVAVVPFYDRSGLIHETLGTLEDALLQQVLVTVLVVLVMVSHLRSAGLISALLPLAVGLTFVAMKLGGVDANVVALSGIAIAIGTMVDVGIVLTESMLRRLDEAGEGGDRLAAVLDGASDVGSAVLTAVLTTIVSFLPVFAMEGAEGKLFRPLAYTKTFALFASIVVALLVIPPAAAVLMAHGRGAATRTGRAVRAVLTVAAAAAGSLWLAWWVGALVLGVAAGRWLDARGPAVLRKVVPRVVSAGLAVLVAVVLARAWAPLGPARDLANLGFTAGVVGGVLLFFVAFRTVYVPVLRLCLAAKPLFLAVPAAIVLLGLIAWLGAPAVVGSVAPGLGQRLATTFPGLGKEFMPSLDEGSFLLMPVTTPHASIGEALDMLQQQDRRIRAIPEVDQVVGKIGRIDSPMDPAPIGMVETVITYLPEFRSDAAGRPLLFAVDAGGAFVRDERGELVPDEDGEPFRDWRPEIRSPRDIWDAVAAAAQVPGMTTASMLQPIETRRIMLQTGMRSNFGVKVYGPDLATIEGVSRQIDGLLREVPVVRPETVYAERVVGKPYLEIDIDRAAIARFGLSIQQVQSVIMVAVGGVPLTRTVEGRERYPVRVRYPRERRDHPDELARVVVGAPDGTQVPLGQLATLRYARGPQSIKSEDTFLVNYVIFDGRPGVAEVEVVEQARAHLQQAVDAGRLTLPPGVSYRFAGAYENQVRAEAKLRVVLPIALLVIFLILYLQFRSTGTTLLVFSGVFVAWAGGFLLLWAYGQDWFLAGELFGVDWRGLFQVGEMHLSVAVWVGFLALFGIATDDGVLMTTYLKQRFDSDPPQTRQQVREATVEAAERRIRPCLMTSATTILALLPVMTSTGRGSDVMVPMAIPSFGGMLAVLVTVFVVPVIWCAVQERRVP